MYWGAERSECTTEATAGSRFVQVFRKQPCSHNNVYFFVLIFFNYLRCKHWFHILGSVHHHNKEAVNCPHNEPFQFTPLWRTLFILNYSEFRMEFLFKYMQTTIQWINTVATELQLIVWHVQPWPFPIFAEGKCHFSRLIWVLFWGNTSTSSSATAWFTYRCVWEM